MRFRDTGIGMAFSRGLASGQSVLGGMRLPRHIRRGHALRVLLLTSGLGTGHSRAAAAVGRALASLAPAIRISTVDFWSLLDAAVARATQQTYLRLVTERPDLYQRLYQLDQRSWRNVLENGQALPEMLWELGALIAPLADSRADFRDWHWIDRLLYRQLGVLLSGPGAGEMTLRDIRQQAVVHQGWALLAKRLARRIARFAPDAVVASQVNIAALAAHLKAEQRFRAPLIGVVTDYGVHNFWLQPQIDVHCVPDASLCEALRAASIASSAQVTGVPLMPEFSHPPSAAAARAQLGLAADDPVVLVLGGGLGLGIGPVVRQLANSSRFQCAHPALLVLGGRNQKLAGELRVDPAVRRLQAAGRLQLLDWTEQMAVHMRAADIVIGKPGGLSTAEVLACGRPLFSTCSLRGQESFNVAFLESHGVGQLLTEENLERRVAELLADRESLRLIQARAWALGRRYGAQSVAALVLDAVRYAADARGS